MKAGKASRAWMMGLLSGVGVLGLANWAGAADGPGDKAPPYVYSVENTGAEFPAPPLPTLEEAMKIEPFPDPFAWAKDPTGKTRSTDFKDWSHHRAEILAQLEHYEIGKKPRVDIAKQVKATYEGSGEPGGKGTMKVTVTVKDQTLTLSVPIAIPAGAKAPYPIMIGMNSPTGTLPANLLSGRGIATATFSHNQVTTYNSKKNTDPYYKLYGPDLNITNTGQYSAWAWGVSRIIDGFTLVKETLPVDLEHIAVGGCSYAGKMALFAGAFDERVALTIAYESGGGGATSWRYSKTERTGSVEGLAQTSHQWFAEQMFKFGGENVSKLPVDHHLLTALVAPRALYLTGNTGFEWLSNPSCYVNSRATAKVYRQFGIEDRFGFCIDGNHGHCQAPQSQIPEMEYFVDKFMKGKTELSKVIATFPESYSKIDHERWTKWWGTGEPVLP